MEFKSIIRIDPKRAVSLFSSSLLLVSTFFLFGPFIIFQGNINEFLVSLTSILSFFFVPALVLLILLTTLGVVLPKQLHKRYVSLLFIFGILFWLQGNVLVWKYGLLDGQGIDWNKSVWRGWLDGSIWLILIFIALIFFEQIYRITAFISIVMLLLQSVFLGVTSGQKPETWQEKDKISFSKPMPQELYQFSSKQNVIIFLLDAFQSDYFQYIINDDFDYYSNIFEGFTFFKETTGSFPTTYMTVPAIFSGKNYKNDMPMPTFLNTIMKGKTISTVLYKMGYDVDLAPISMNLAPDPSSVIYQIPVPYGVNKEHFTQASAALMIDLVLFRHVPHIFKKYIYNDRTWLMQRLLFTGVLSRKDKIGPITFRYFAHEAFLADLNNNLTVTRTKSVFKFFHLATTHAPMVVTRDCKYAGKPLKTTKENRKNQSRCSLEHIIKILFKLKSRGIYDSSLIVLMADTGGGLKVKLKNMNKKVKGFTIGSDRFAAVVGSALPLMVIKPPFSKGPLRISTAQTMLTDLPATISSILNLKEQFSGRSMFEIDPNETRERTFFYYKWRHENWLDEYFKRIDEFIIEGSVFDLTSWRKGLTYYPPKDTRRVLKKNISNKK